MGHLLLRTALATTLGVGLHLGALSPVLAQGVPVVDTQNIAQNIQQLRQMIEDEILQNEQLTQLREQLGLLTDQLAELQRTYEALTRLAELPEIIRTEMEDELNELCRTDPLTNALNRRAYNDMLLREFSRFGRSNHKYSIIMIDLDDFKKINDLHGHDAGDRVLIEVTEKCKDCLRVHDSIARIGGEEFSIILSYTDAKQAQTVAERIRKEIALFPLLIGGERIEITISVGIAEVLEDDRDHRQIVKRADKMLYQAKNRGKNQVCAQA